MLVGKIKVIGYDTCDFLPEVYEYVLYTECNLLL